jgi:WD40 repeat protein
LVEQFTLTLICLADNDIKPQIYCSVVVDVLKCVTIRTLIIGSQDGLLKTWSLDVSDFAENFTGHKSAVTCLDIASDNTFAVSGSSDMTLRVWSITMATVITLYKVSL